MGWTAHDRPSHHDPVACRSHPAPCRVSVGLPIACLGPDHEPSQRPLTSRYNHSVRRVADRVLRPSREPLAQTLPPRDNRPILGSDGPDLAAARTLAQPALAKPVVRPHRVAVMPAGSPLTSCLRTRPRHRLLWYWRPWRPPPLTAPLPDTPKPNMACFSLFDAFYRYAPHTFPCGATAERIPAVQKNSGLRNKYSPSFRGFSIS
jgi:hypothetical protein